MEESGVHSFLYASEPDENSMDRIQLRGIRSQFWQEAPCVTHRGLPFSSQW